MSSDWSSNSAGGSPSATSHLTPRPASKTFYRRVALSYIFLFVALLTAVVWAMGRPACRASLTCPRQIWMIGLAVTIPAIVLLAWLWGRWYERTASVLSVRLEREYKQQVDLVDSERQRQATVLNQMADGVLMTDDSGRIQFLNPAAMRLLKTEEVDALDQPFAGVVFNHQLIELWQKSQSERVEQTAALEFDRGGLFIQAVISPIQLVNRWGCLVILQDLTHIRRLETVRRDFISNVSHELLTPIAALRALVETLQDGAIDDPPAAQRFLGRALNEVDSLSQIVSELLTLSRIEAGQVTLRLRPVPVEELLQRPLDQLMMSAERQGITLTTDIAAGCPHVLADVEQIWHVLNNILHNALKYTPEGGTIELQAGYLQRGGAEGQVVFAVVDSGIGIPQEDVPRIFERFYKADRARQRDRKSGTGLGLSIAKHIIQAHGGRIWASSKEGKGSTFYFTLPEAGE